MSHNLPENPARDAASAALCKAVTTPEEWLAWLDDLADTLRYSRSQAAVRAKENPQPWHNLADAIRLVADEDATSKATAEQELDEVKVELDNTETALEQALEAYHEAHPEPHTMDATLCQNVECSKLQRLWRGRHLSIQDYERIRS